MEEYLKRIADALERAFPLDPDIAFFEKAVQFEQYRSRGVAKAEILLPSEHGKHKKICFPPSMGSTFLISATPLEKYGQKN